MRLRLALTVTLLPAAAFAAPWDGERFLQDGDRALPLHEVPRAFTVTWEPGVLPSLPPEERLLAPAELAAGPFRLEHIGPVGPARYHSDEYRLLNGPADPGAVARALLDLPGVRTAGPLLRLDRTPEAPWRAVTPDLLVRLADAAHEADLERWAGEHGVEVAGPRGGLPDQWRLSLSAGAALDPVDAATRLREQPWTLYAQVDWLQPREPRHVPADAEYPNQWHLNNTGQGGGVPGNDVSAEEAWDLGVGSPDVIVAVLDTGVQLDHPDLQADLLPGYDYVDGDADPSPQGSHGTSVAGVAAAPENGEGVVGACPGCLIIPLRVIGGSDSAEADAHIFAVDHGADVINNSWGPVDGAGTYVPMGPAVQSAVEYAVTQGRGGLGVAIFWAAGNGAPADTCDQDGYASHPDVFAIGANTNAGVRSNYSESCPELDLSAPSNGGTRGIWTTRTGGGYTSNFGGTSSAAPLAAGVAALVLSSLPDLSLEQLRELLQQSAAKIDPSGGAWDDNGHSIHYGWGRVDAYAALSSELAFLNVPQSRASCESALDAVVSVPNGEGLGRLEVTAWSQTEETPEVFVLVETQPGRYEGTVQLGSGAAVPDDGIVASSHEDVVTIVSADSGTQRTVTLDCRVPTISSITVDELTPTSARIAWVTDELADGRAVWGEGAGEEAYHGQIGLAHNVYAIDLEPCTAYRADLESEDPLGNVGVLRNGATWQTPGDPEVVPEGAPEGADPCDPDTWTVGGDDDDDDSPGVVQQELTSGDGDACSSCAVADPGAAGWAALLLLPALRRRRRD